MEARCRIELFGEIRLIRDDRIVTRFRTRKTAHLLACLALPPGRSHLREALIDRFWPDLDLDAGRDNLSMALSALRKELEPDDIPSGAVLVADRQSVRLNSAAVTTDVLELEELLGQAGETADSARRSSLLERAVALYRGDLAPDCYDDWVLPEQRRWQERYVDVLLEWSRTLEETGALETALEAARRAATADPFREEACTRRIELYAARGRFADANRCYREFERKLDEESGAAPSASLRVLAERLRADPDSIVLPSNRSSHPVDDSVDRSSPILLETALRPRFPPPPPTLNRFHGREDEIARLAELLTSGRGVETDGAAEAGDTDIARAPRLVTLTGPGGAGKTRMAVEIAHRVAPAYGERVAFVPLDSVNDPRRIAGVLLRVFGITCSPEADPYECIAAALGPAPVLLVLDNLEQLLVDDGPHGGRATLLRLLAQVPAIRCLVTSRQALAIEGEQEVRIAPLSTPSETGMACESVALYLDRVRANDPGFALTDENKSEVASLCNRLEGLPLAIEMAAAWTRVLPPRTLRERLEQGLDDLTMRRKEVPERHRSLRATLEWSHCLLDSGLRQAFAAFSVFRGGWTLEAAEAVAGAKALEALADLSERSLLVIEEEGTRYRYLEVVREYARERLRERGEAEARDRHAEIYLRLAEGTTARASGLGPAAWTDLRRESANLDEALEWLAESGRAKDLTEIVVTLEGFWVEEGHHLADGAAWTDRALSLYPHRDAVRARALNTAGWLAFLQGRHADARERYEESRSIAREREDRPGIAGAGIALARVAADIRDADETKRLTGECEAIFRDLGDRPALANGLFALAGVMRTIGERGVEERLLSESAELMRALERRHDLSRTLYSLAGRARERGDMETAQGLWEECVAIDESLGVRGGGALWGLGTLAELRGDGEEASRWYERSLRENLEIENYRGVSEGLLALAEDRLREGAPERSARLLGASLMQRSLTDQTIFTGRRTQVERLAAELRERLGNDRLEALTREGWRMDPEAGIALALEDLTGQSDTRPNV